MESETLEYAWRAVVHGFEVAFPPREAAARVLAYVFKRGLKFHRDSAARLLLYLFEDPRWRPVAWALVQEAPPGLLLTIAKVVDKKHNIRPLRHAVAVRLATLPPREIIRLFALSPARFRSLFSYLKLPRRAVHGKPIATPSYRLAAALADKGLGALRELGYTPAKLAGLGVPFHVLVNLVESPEEAAEVAKALPPKLFFEHARWFRCVLGEDEYEALAEEKMRRLGDPLELLMAYTHLVETGALTGGLARLYEQVAKRKIVEAWASHGVRRVMLVVDRSGSMRRAVEITKKLYRAFSFLPPENIRIVAFNETACEVSPEDLERLEPCGFTSIGAGLALAYRIIRSGFRADLVILVTDWEENEEPWARDAVKLLKTLEKPPPLVILKTPSAVKVSIDYPHAVVPTPDFHPRLLGQIFELIARLAARALEPETLLLGSRKPLAEELGEVVLPKRPTHTYEPGFLERLLCGGEA